MRIVGDRRVRPAAHNAKYFAQYEELRGALSVLKASTSRTLISRLPSNPIFRSLPTSRFSPGPRESSPMVVMNRKLCTLSEVNPICHGGHWNEDNPHIGEFFEIWVGCIGRNETDEPYRETYDS